jgi:FMN phosphatase YigB (HAD superfamily)
MIAKRIKLFFPTVLTVSTLGLTSSLTGISASTCLFIDDDIINVDAAINCGMHSIQYQNYHQLKFDLKNRIDNI